MFDIFFGFSFLIFFLLSGIAIAWTLFWLWMLIDCATKEPSEGNDKLIWVIIIVFTNLLGALIYFFIRRPKRIQDYGR
ncbi:PLDc N-terminal domain-containing protein [Methanolobus sp. WCC5]|uniref:PLDc N-terminal domain-containing protein n=1 Tax=Methanolobus sp. WCC5 TaxID=3125785 RepID=UPI00324C57EB